ncbi:MAG: hypothetical protein LUF85_16560 [Bacteroides sp.]|nr:hypothetical protein [Bacteroides sp.]
MKETYSEPFFTPRFDGIIRSLGLLSYMYVQGGGSGLERQQCMALAKGHTMHSSDILSFLEDHLLLEDRQGLLHLNCDLFFSLSLWQLLILAEPWLLQETPRFCDNCPLPDIPDVSAIRAFACSQNLSEFYIHTYH